MSPFNSGSSTSAQIYPSTSCQANVHTQRKASSTNIWKPSQPQCESDHPRSYTSMLLLTLLFKSLNYMGLKDPDPQTLRLHTCIIPHRLIRLTLRHQMRRILRQFSLLPMLVTKRHPRHRIPHLRVPTMSPILVQTYLRCWL